MANRSSTVTLNIFQDGQADLAVEALLGESVAVLGIKGSGKSNSAAVLAEELLGAGLPLCIVDIAGEYWGLKERDQVLVAGRSAHVDVEIDPTGGAALAEFSLRHSVPVILDLSGFRKQERFDLLLGFFEQLWDLAGELRRPYQIVLEEAHNFIPQAGSTPVSDVLVRIAAEGRKRGLGIVLVGQRSSRIDKNVLTQAGILLLHRVRHPADVSVYQDIIPKERAWVKTTATALQTGQAIWLCGETVAVAAVRERHTFHAGYTPGMEAVVAPELRTIDAAMLSHLQALLAARQPAQADPEIERLRHQVRDLERERDSLLAQVAAQGEEIARLKSEIEMLGHLRVTVDSAPVAAGGEIAVEAIHAQQLIAPGLQPHPNGVPASEPWPALPPAPPAPQAGGYRSPLATTRAIKRQERRFQSLLQDLRSLPRHHRRILAYLVERDDLALTPRELARFVGYSESTITGSPPTKLLKMGLLKRSDKRGRYRYAANVQVLWGELFPDLDADVLVEQLLAEVR
jgi:hypothetical protein